MAVLRGGKFDEGSVGARRDQVDRRPAGQLDKTRNGQLAEAHAGAGGGQRIHLGSGAYHSTPRGRGELWQLVPCTKGGRQGRGRLTLLPPNRFHAAYVQSHFTVRLLNVCQSVDEGISQVVVVA